MPSELLCSIHAWNLLANLNPRAWAGGVSQHVQHLYAVGSIDSCAWLAFQFFEPVACATQEVQSCNQLAEEQNY